MEDGYIKFKAKWDQSPALPYRFIKELNKWRNLLYQMKLVGAYDDGIGYGNISQRFGNSGHFIISGSGTGNLESLTPDHFSLVTNIDIDHNLLHCKGPIMASSESMSHGVIYRECTDIHGVIHIHNKELWLKLLDKVPTTSEKAEYGTPEMAYEIIRLFRETDLMEKRIIVMKGHEEGIFTFGKSLDEAGKIILNYIQNLE
jgi:ribulose-5-phosphate 4-epimerase/fuculose-1-phosphate aldolase